MSLFARLRSALGAGRPRVRSEPLDSADIRRVSHARADVTITRSEAIYAAVSRISNTIAQLPLHLYKGWEIQEDDPLERLCRYAPNDNMTAYQFQQAMEAYRNTEGN
ncbi:MAG: phage portal protein, partial [Candidatus Fimadaptatus sp.]